MQQELFLCCACADPIISAREAWHCHQPLLGLHSSHVPFLPVTWDSWWLLVNRSGPCDDRPCWRRREDAVANGNDCVNCKERKPLRGLRTKAGMWRFIQQGFGVFGLIQGLRGPVFQTEQAHYLNLLISISFCCKLRIILILGAGVLLSSMMKEVITEWSCGYGSLFKCERHLQQPFAQSMKRKSKIICFWELDQALFSVTELYLSVSRGDVAQR